MKTSLCQMLEGSMKDLPVEVKEYGMIVGEKISIVEIITGIRRLLNVERGMSVRARFSIGDLYNRIAKNKGLRKEVVQAISGEFGGKTYQLIRTYGWVAAKWEQEQRNDDKPWGWWVSNKPGEPERTTDNYETPLDVVTREQREQGEVLHCVAKNGRKFVIHMRNDVPITAHRDSRASSTTTSFCGTMIHEDRETYAVSK